MIDKHKITYSRLTREKQTHQVYFYCKSFIFLTLASPEAYCSLWHFLIVYCEVSSDGYEWKDFQHQLNIQFITLFRCNNEVYSNKIYAFQCDAKIFFTLFLPRFEHLSAESCQKNSAILTVVTVCLSCLCSVLNC